MRSKLSSGSDYERLIGYSRAIVDGDLIFVSGTTGFDYATMTIPDTAVEQAEQAFRTIDRTLQEADACLADIARVRYILPDINDFESCWPVLRRHLGDAAPAATVFEARLLDPRMKIEIEVTACRRADKTSLGASL